MRLFPRGLWRYAVLIVLLLVIAAIASKETISSITELVLEVKQGQPVSDDLLLRIVSIPILALTMGFLFLAGALGIWAIRTTAVIEGRRRIGRFVDTMDYLRDGILAVDEGGLMTGINPSARQMADSDPGPSASLRDMFTCLTDSDAAVLLDRSGTRELECVSRAGDRIRALRFRSQPAEDMNLILISDVTGRKSEEMRTRQVARLQLIGRIARGVAHDFNNILCAISGHASLLARGKGSVAEANESLQAVLKESQRGASLAGQLLELSRTGVKGNPCLKLREHVQKAIALLKVGLSAEWQIIADIEGVFGSVALTDSQVEQVFVNLGLLVADELPAPGFMHVRIRAPGDGPLLDVGREYVAVGIVSAYGPEKDAGETRLHMESDGTVSEAGVIQSVVRSVLEEVGGRLDIMVGPGGKHSYRVCIPQLVSSDDKMSALAGVSEEVRMAVANWQVLLAGAMGGRRGELEGYLEELGMTVEVSSDIVSALQHVEAGRELTAMIVERKLLGAEADALLRAIRKLRPLAGLVVLCDLPDRGAANLKSSCVFEAVDASPETLLQALMQARELVTGGRIAG